VVAPKTRRRRRLGPRLAVTLNVALVVGLLTAVGGVGFLHVRLAAVPRVDLADSLDDEPDGDSAQNFLLVGTDSAAGLDPDDPVTNGREDLGVLADTIMVLRVDPDSPQAQLLSLPRDLYLDVPGAGEQKLNSALSIGGQEALISTIQDNLGIPIHHYLQVDFRGFKELVAAIDGVPFFFDTPVRDTATGLFVGHRGCVTLGPDQALAYARSRHLEYREGDEWISDGTADLGRISRQQDFIRRALARTVSEGLANPLLLGDVLGVASDAALLDDGMGVDEFVQLGRKFRGIDDDTLQTLTLDVSDDTVDGSAILRLQDTEANDRKIGIFRGQAGSGSQQAPEIGVIVLNGTGTDGQAGEIADGLDRLGFDTSPGTGDAENSDFGHSVVRYTSGNEAQARFVAAQIEGGADVEEVDSIEGGADVAVVTGDDIDGVSSDLQPPPVPLGTGAGGSGGGGAGGGSAPVGEVPVSDPPEQADC
jgi:LCP family protein required for cell wall assembly